MSSVFVATPYTRPLFGGYVRSLLFTQKPDELLWLDKYGEARAPARNWLTYQYRKHKRKPEFLLFVDGDCDFHEESMLRLVSRNLPVVFGCMYTTDTPPTPTVGYYSGTNKEGITFYKFGEVCKKIIRHCRSHGLGLAGDRATLPRDNSLTLKPTEDDLLEVDGGGMHFTMIRRDVIEAIQAPWFEHIGLTGAGEDFYFCRKVKEAGFKLYLDLSVHTGHRIGERSAEVRGIRELLKFVQDRTDEELESAIMESESMIELGAGIDNYNELTEQFSNNGLRPPGERISREALWGRSAS